MKHLSSDFHPCRLNDLGGALDTEHVDRKRLRFTLGDQALGIHVSTFPLLTADIALVHQLSESQSHGGPADPIVFLELIFGRDRLAQTIFSLHDFIADRLAQLVNERNISVSVQRSHRYVVITIKYRSVYRN